MGNPCAPKLRGPYCELCDRTHLEPGEQVYYKAAGELYMWGASYARSKELLLLASALLSSEVRRQS